MRRPLALLLSIALLPGCASYVEHLSDVEHPWHAWPMIGGFAIGWVPFLPLAAVEDMATGSRNFAPCPEPEGIGLVGVWIGTGLGIALGTPFYVLGLPFEGGGEEEIVPVPDEGTRP